MIEAETWKSIPNYEGIYEINNYGNVKSLSRTILKQGKYPSLSKERILKSNVGFNGYCKIDLSKDSKVKSVNIHQLVAMAFLNHTPCGFKLVVDHIDLNKLNNNASNLRITTSRINTNKKHLKSSSKYTGVSWNKTVNKWGASIFVNGKLKKLGFYDEEYDAHLAYENELIIINGKTK